MKTKIIAEIGINHNGSLEMTKKLIDVAVIASCDYVKFQKRNPDVCVPEGEKNKIKSTPWGEMTYLEYKHKIEFGKEEYDEIDRYCREKKIGWFASVWDLDSVDFMSQYTTKFNDEEKIMMKIPSALITNDELIKYAKEKSDYLMVSTGMSTEEEIVKCINICEPDLIFHTNSTYPSPIEELNLGYIKWLTEKYPNKEIGYSGHEFGLTTTFAATTLGATWIERHITLDRAIWGSDQMASVEPSGLIKLIKGIKDIEIASSNGYGPREVIKSELSKRKTLRGE
jgi:N-acetylneuraminate synthase